MLITYKYMCILFDQIYMYLSRAHVTSVLKHALRQKQLKDSPKIVDKLTDTPNSCCAYACTGLKKMGHSINALWHGYGRLVLLLTLFRTNHWKDQILTFFWLKVFVGI